MVPNHNKCRQAWQLYNRYKRKEKIRVMIFTPLDIIWNKRSVRCLYPMRNRWIKRWYPFPDAVYNRCYLKKKSSIMQRFESVLGEEKCFNRVTHLDKWDIQQLLVHTELNCHIPETWMYNSELLKELIVEEKRLIVKPCYGSQGRRVYLLVHTEDKLFHIYQDTLTPIYTTIDEQAFYQEINQLIGKTPFIMQRVIKLAKVDNQMVDIRILMQKNKMGNWIYSKGICRVAPPHFFITNRSEDIRELDEVLETWYLNPIEREQVYQKVKSISIRAAQLIEESIGGMGELGLDLAIDQNGAIWIIEINGRPQKKLYYKLKRNTGKDINLVYKLPLEYAYYLSQK